MKEKNLVNQDNVITLNVINEIMSKEFFPQLDKNVDREECWEKVEKARIYFGTSVHLA